MADQNPDLLKQADELGIKTDKRWGDDRLQQEIDKALAGPAPDPDGNPPDESAAPPDPLDHDRDGKKRGAAPALHAMRVNRDFWDAAGERHHKGTVIDVTADEAIAGAESGALSRVK